MRLNWRLNLVYFGKLVFFFSLWHCLSFFSGLAEFKFHPPTTLKKNCFVIILNYFRFANETTIAFVASTANSDSISVRVITGVRSNTITTPNRKCRTSGRSCAAGTFRTPSSLDTRSRRRRRWPTGWKRTICFKELTNLKELIWSFENCSFVKVHKFAAV